MTWRINCSPDTSQEQTLPDISDTSLNLELSNSLVVKGLGLVGPDDTFDVSRGYVVQPQGTFSPTTYFSVFPTFLFGDRCCCLAPGSRPRLKIYPFYRLFFFTFRLF